MGVTEIRIIKNIEDLKTLISLLKEEGVIAFRGFGLDMRLSLGYNESLPATADAVSQVPPTTEEKPKQEFYWDLSDEDAGEGVVS